MKKKNVISNIMFLFLIEEKVFMNGKGKKFLIKAVYF